MASSGLASTHNSTFLAVGLQLQRTGGLRRTSCLSSTSCQSWSLRAAAANTSCRVCDGKCRSVVPHQRVGAHLQLAGKGKKSIRDKVGSWKRGREVQAFAQLAVAPAGSTERLGKVSADKIYSEGRDGAKGVRHSGTPLHARGGSPRSHLCKVCARISSGWLSDRVDSRIGCRALSDSGAQSGVGVVQSTEPKMQGDGSDINVEAVLFDMDGVLCDSESRSRQAAAELFHEMGYPDVVEADFVPFTGTGELNFLSGVARKYGVEGFDGAKAKERFYQIYMEKFAVPDSGLGYAGALELVKACKDAGLKIAVASSADRVKVNANLRASSIPIEMFDAVASADSFERLKPAPDVFLAAARSLGVPPPKCVVIEDAPAGVKAANAAGMRCIALVTSVAREVLKSENPTLMKNAISDVSLETIRSLQYPSGKDMMRQQEGDHQREQRVNAGKEEEKGIAKAKAVNVEDKLVVLKEENEGKSALATMKAGADTDEEAQLEAPGFLDVEVTLPNGYATTRRDILKLASAGMGSFTVFTALSRAKALSYVSPKAVLNEMFAFLQPSMTGVAVAGEDRVGRFRGFLKDLEKRGGGPDVPEFLPTLDWLNSPPLKLSKDLRGKMVILDFWTYCCINCMHILPDLAFLEKKYASKPVVVVGVHSAKFDNEKDLESIRNAVLRYDITHPVVNDGDMTMWRALGVSSWPTLAIISPRGKLIGLLSGEGHREDVDEILQAALDFYGAKEMLDDTPIPLSLEKEKDVRLIGSPLKFPGKLATDLANGRLFISDSNHHRIVVTDLNGEFITQIGGAGGEGLRDGTFEYAAFNRPQGLTYHSGRNVLYVADTENHALREVDFVNEKVTTLAGNGTQGSDVKGGGRGPSQVLNSPWDVVVDEKNGKVYVAMAGQHQIWTYDIDSGVAQMFSGNGYERNLNGRSGNDSSFAQPSGLSLSTDRTVLYVADSESSSIRVVNLQTGGTTLYAGGDPAFADNLFKFGDKDGFGPKAELQHPLGVLQSLDGSIYIADSYNHKIKKMNPSTKEVISVAGNGRAGFKDGKGTSSQCSEPAGLAQGLNGKIFIADTNNNVIRVLDTAENGAIYTLELKSVPLPSPEAPSTPGKRRRRGSVKSRVDTEVVRLATVERRKGQLALKISIPQGYHFTKGAISKYEVDADSEDIMIQPVSGDLVTSGLSASASVAFERIDVNDSTKMGDELMTRINCKVYYCQEDDVCLYKALTFEIPFAAATTFTTADAPREATTIPVMYSVIPKAGPRTQLL